jgi:hypothetical protein
MKVKKRTVILNDIRLKEIVEVFIQFVLLPRITEITEQRKKAI